MTTDDHILEIVQAHKDGKKIETMSDLHPEWVDCMANPVWNFAHQSYRIAPEEREFKSHGIDINKWADEKGLPWKVVGAADIHDNTNNWIGNFSSFDDAEEVVSLMNSIPELFNITDAILNRKREVIE
jgi:hypothetical protein